MTRRKSYKVGNLFRVCHGSGLASGKVVTIIPNFSWRNATDGTYRAPGPDQVPVQYKEDGVIGFMYKHRLIEL
jgi:hypothetical protein